jgi:uncharacterized protein (DUF1501 family)
LMTLSRRSLLKNAGTLSLASLLLEPRLLLAQSAASGHGKNIVVINLLGGMDGLAAFPYYSGPLASIINSELRPTLRIPPESVLPVESQNGEPNKIGLHPAFLPLHRVVGDRMKIIQGYGIPGDPGRSHDTCQTLMSLGASSLRGGENIGFLARLMDAQDWDSFQYWALLSENPSDINTTKKPPVVVSDIESLQYPKLWRESSGDAALATSIQDALIEAQTPRDSLAAQQKDTQVSLSRTLAIVRRDLMTQQVGNNASGNYATDGVGASLRDAARILKAKRSSSDASQVSKDTLILLGQGGYDTHSNQNSLDPNEGLQGNLSNLAGNLAVFWQDVILMGSAQDTVVVLYSEFGRTLYQNGTPGMISVGTDHGHGNMTLVFGGPVSAGVLGTAPSVSQIRDEEYNALLPTLDYRDIFSEVLVWLGIDPISIFNEQGFSPRRIGLIG